MAQTSTHANIDKDCMGWMIMDGQSMSYMKLPGDPPSICQEQDRCQVSDNVPSAQVSQKQWAGDVPDNETDNETRMTGLYILFHHPPGVQ